MQPGHVVAVHRSAEHGFSKPVCDAIEVMAGLGVRADAHSGELVQHLSRVRVDPTQPNLRQVHLIHYELFDELSHLGFDIRPGDLGENISTRRIDLLALGRNDRLMIGEAVLRVTGLRNPCGQIESFRPGLLEHLAYRHEDEIIRKAGIMCVVETGGIIRARDAITIEPAVGPHVKLDRV